MWLMGGSICSFIIQQRQTLFPPPPRPTYPLGTRCSSPA
jgi:hypothetical protein